MGDNLNPRLKYSKGGVDGVYLSMHTNNRSAAVLSSSSDGADVHGETGRTSYKSDCFRCSEELEEQPLFCNQIYLAPEQSCTKKVPRNILTAEARSTQTMLHPTTEHQRTLNVGLASYA